MNPNPYAPPAAQDPPPEAAPRRRLFTATAVGAWYFFFAPVGALLAMANYRRLGDRGGVLRAFAAFFLTGCGLLALGLVTHGRAQFLLVLAARWYLAVLAFLPLFIPFSPSGRSSTPGRPGRPEPAAATARTLASSGALSR